MTTRPNTCLFLFVGASSLTWIAGASAELPRHVQEFLAGLDENGVPEGHMLIGGDIIVLEDSLSRATFATNFWPDGTVPYVYADNVTAANRTRMRDAMDEWESVANVHFEFGVEPWGLIVIQDSDQNSSQIGKTGIVQIINIKNWGTHYTIMHELAHALGFWHEQSRMDRGDYVEIHRDRVIDGKEHNFDIELFSHNYGPYDFDSVMHYRPCSFSTCDDCSADFYNCRTIEVLPPCDACWETEIGQRDHLSKFDQLTMSFIYRQPNWIFVARDGGVFSAGSFLDPYVAVVLGVGAVPGGGTLWIQPGEYAAVATYSNAMTIRAPLGGVLLSNANGSGPGTSFDCCDPGPQRSGSSTGPLEPVELQ